MTDSRPTQPMSGVVATLVPIANERYRLTLDDVTLALTLDATMWKREGLFTHRDFDASALRELKLNQSQLAEIGENLLLRLLPTPGAPNPDGNYRAT